jgi:hypothetical protein
LYADELGGDHIPLLGRKEPILRHNRVQRHCCCSFR